MSLLVDELAAWLAAQGEGTVAVDLFTTSRPAEPANCTTLYQAGGPPDRYLTIDRRMVLVEVRATSPDAALTRAEALYARCHDKAHLELTAGGAYVHAMRALGAPEQLGTEGTNHLAGFTLEVTMKRAA